MVELCELKLMDQNLESQWPADIDQHIAELDFQRSTDEEDTSLFSSTALDPSVISTDSLDIEKLHARCKVCYFISLSLAYVENVIVLPHFPSIFPPTTSFLWYLFSLTSILHFFTLVSIKALLTSKNFPSAQPYEKDKISCSPTFHILHSSILLSLCVVTLVLYFLFFPVNDNNLFLPELHRVLCLTYIYVCGERFQNCFEPEVKKGSLPTVQNDSYSCLNLLVRNFLQILLFLIPLKLLRKFRRVLKLTTVVVTHVDEGWFCFEMELPKNIFGTILRKYC